MQSLVASTKTVESWSTNPQLMAGFGGICGSAVGRAGAGAAGRSPRPKQPSLKDRIPPGMTLAQALRHMAKPDPNAEPLLGLPGRTPAHDDGGGFLPLLSAKSGRRPPPPGPADPNRLFARAMNSPLSSPSRSPSPERGRLPRNLPGRLTHTYPASREGPRAGALGSAKRLTLLDPVVGVPKAPDLPPLGGFRGTAMAMR